MGAESTDDGFDGFESEVGFGAVLVVVAAAAALVVVEVVVDA